MPFLEESAKDMSAALVNYVLNIRSEEVILDLSITTCRCRPTSILMSQTLLTNLCKCINLLLDS